MIGERAPCSVLLGAMCATVLGAATAHAATPIYLDRTYSHAERAADLVARMTTAEKASQTISQSRTGDPTARDSKLGPVE